MTDVTVVGAGPVGLFLALRLHALGVRAEVLERRPHGRDGSRSIGVHPPALEKLDLLGVGARFLERGVRVRAGLAFAGDRALGRLDFGSCAGRHRYVLTLPQRETEALLREALAERAPGALKAGAEVLEVRRDIDAVSVTVRRAGRVRARERPLVVGCDGRHSVCRETSAIPFRGERYPGSYLMGDAPDTTPYGEDAAVFLHEDGLVESFPLPGGLRRWVVRRSGEGKGSPEELAEAIRERTGSRPPREDIARVSTFRAEHFLAERLAVGRLALAGDAAHVVSPIGGQGMNLGWLGAWSLAAALAGAARAGRPTPRLCTDARRRRRMARAAARRAELNMWLGRPSAGGGRDRLLRGLLAQPMALGLARLFTMRGLACGV